jgi:hypothetical protein
VEPVGKLAGSVAREHEAGAVADRQVHELGAGHALNADDHVHEFVKRILDFGHFKTSRLRGWAGFALGPFELSCAGLPRPRHPALLALAGVAGERVFSIYRQLWRRLNSADGRFLVVRENLPSRWQLRGQDPALVAVVGLDSQVLSRSSEAN